MLTPEQLSTHLLRSLKPRQRAAHSHLLWYFTDHEAAKGSGRTYLTAVLTIERALAWPKIGIPILDHNARRNPYPLRRQIFAILEAEAKRLGIADLPSYFEVDADPERNMRYLVYHGGLPAWPDRFQAQGRETYPFLPWRRPLGWEAWRSYFLRFVPAAPDPDLDALGPWHKGEEPPDWYIHLLT